MELNVLGLRPRTFNCRLENVKSQKLYIFNLVYYAIIILLLIFSDSMVGDVCPQYCVRQGKIVEIRPLLVSAPLAPQAWRQ